MKKFLLSIIVSLTITIASAQTNIYHPFPEDSAIWVVDNYAQPPACNGYCSTVAYRMYGDTLINAISYNKLWVESFMFVGPFNPPYNYVPDNYIGAIRQDSINKKVYYIDASMTSDTLLYDFDLAVGDTLPQTYCTNGLPQPSIVSGIDSILMSNSYHKRFKFANTISGFDTDYLIEGVGAGGGLFYLYEFFEGGPVLNCFREADTHNCAYTFAGIFEHDNKSLLSISPNPFAIETTLHSDNIFHDATATVYNCYGKIVKQMKNINGNTVTLTREDIPSGMYFLKMTEKEMKFSVNKLIVIDN